MAHALPRSLADLQALVSQQVQESLHLDYKASTALQNKAEISKDVSAFLNSDGGAIIYGITESAHIPSAVDGGVAASSFSRETLEQIILSNIAPRPTGVEVVAIPVSPTHFAYAIGIPKSFRGPHQDSKTGKYYKRFEFQSVHMQHFEIEDVRARRALLEPLLSVDVEIHRGILVQIVVANTSDLPAHDVSFAFDPPLPWRDRSELPPLLKNGTKYLPPKRQYHFLYESYIELMAEGSKKPKAFTVTATYRHPLADKPVDEVFHFDLMDYLNSSVVEPEAAQAAKEVAKVIEKLTTTIERLRSHVEGISSVAGATGLTLSIPTIQNLQSIASGQFAHPHPDRRHWTPDAFREALGVDRAMAMRLYQATHHEDLSSLETIEGMTPDLAERVKRLFRGNT